MVDSNFKEAFLAEAREQLDSLNDGILKLEKEKENSDYINQVFRACHTIKSSSAMMGYNTFSELSHTMESLLDKVRSNNLKVTPEIIDLLFEGSDLLEEGLENITEKDIDSINTDAITAKIEKAQGKEPETKEEETSIPKLFKPDDSQEDTINEETSNGLNVFRMIVFFNEKSPLKGAKAQILVKKLKESTSQLIHANPRIDELEEGHVQDAFEIVASTKSSKKEMGSVLNSVAEAFPIVLDLDEEFERPKELFPSETAKRSPAKVLGRPIQSIKVDVKKLDTLVNLVGELLISNMRLKQISKELGSPALSDAISSIDLLTANIQEQVMQERMVPVGQIFNRFPRLVRDLSAAEKKKVNLMIEGDEIELDRTVLDEIGEPLIHALRNSVDHGIESPQERTKMEKPEEGTIYLSARREKNTAIIEIKDDGKGIDVNKVVSNAISKGLITEKEAAELSPNEKLNLVFRPGLSTKEKITEVSGRGVGMDVVISKIKRIGGNVKLYSTPKKGTTIEMKLPLTLAIISSLIVKVDKDKYAIPLSHVLMTIELPKEEIKTIQGNELTILRDEDVPIIRLHDYFNIPRLEKDIYSVVITERGDRKVGFIVDSIINQQPILIKNLHKLVRGIKGIAGASILGDGKVCLILDIENIS